MLERRPRSALAAMQRMSAASLCRRSAAHSRTTPSTRSTHRRLRRKFRKGVGRSARCDADALAPFDKVQREHPEVAVVGRSLGTGAAIHLASQRPCFSPGARVTPYDSIEEIAVGVHTSRFAGFSWTSSSLGATRRRSRCPRCPLGATVRPRSSPSKHRAFECRLAKGVASLRGSFLARTTTPSPTRHSSWDAMRAALIDCAGLLARVRPSRIPRG